jgi:hypothetical protein
VPPPRIPGAAAAVEGGGASAGSLRALLPGGAPWRRSGPAARLHARGGALGISNIPHAPTPTQPCVRARVCAAVCVSRTHVFPGMAARPRENTETQATRRIEWRPQCE